MMKKIIVIVGQTATGKSALAIRLAKKLSGEIISADSRQVYKGLDIGTAKITKKEMRGVPHHLLDIVDPKKKFTVALYQQKTIYAIAEIMKRGKLPIICGGTGFYIDAVVNGVVFPEVSPNNKLRKILKKKKVSELFKILNKLDKRRAKNIDKNNKVRLIRAIEIARYLGKVPKIIETKPEYNFVKVGIRLDEKDLKKNIEKRVARMFKSGLLNEIKKLKKAGVSDKRLREFGFEYWKPTRKSIISGTLKYARRQNTWFKRDKKIKWFSPTPYKKIEKYVSKKIL